MSKKYGFWRGRPNQPPLNWELPHKPIIRRVGRLRFSSVNQTKVPGNISPTTHSITLPSQQWIMILKALFLYRHFHDDQINEAWRLRIREKVLKVVDETLLEKHYTVSLHLSDWESLIRKMRKVAEWKGDKWLQWEQGMSHYISHQISKGTKGR